MKTRSGWIRGALVVAVVVGLPATREADARGGHGGHAGGHAGGGHAGRPPRMPTFRAPRMPAPKPPKMPKVSAPAHNAMNMARAATPTHNPHAGNSHTNAAVAHRGTTGNVHSGTNAAVARSNATAVNRGTSAVAAHPKAAGATAAAVAAGTNHAASAAAVPTSRNSTSNPYAYTYGTGAGARSYRAYGYGQGYRNRYVGGRYGYGRSQGNNRAIVSRLRSVHASLARLDHDYKGHRVRGMHSISMAIRQLSHRSMIYQNGGFGGFGSRMASNRGMGMRQNGLGAGRQGGQRMSQAQSDARMGQALRTLQGVNMQLTSQGTSTSGHARASGHVMAAIQHLNTALMVRLRAESKERSAKCGAGPLWFPPPRGEG